MEVVLWDGGLQQQEIAAIEKIQKHFQDKKSEKQKGNKGVESLANQLKAAKENSQESMFPWKGYAGFRFTDNRGKEGEFDLVIVTHSNILVIELKDWNNGKITANKGKWQKNGQEMGNSPVSVTQRKLFLLKNKLNKYKNKFSSQFLPKIEHLVVMTGNADFSELPENDLAHTISLEQFFSFKNRHAFNKRFRPHPKANNLQNDIGVFEQIFSQGNTAPKHLYVNGYKAVEKTFEHPEQIYTEFKAVSEQKHKQQDEALLRVWDFNKISDSKAKTPEGRRHIATREREILNFIKHRDYELYKHCLRAMPGNDDDHIPAEYCELYELPPSHKRFNEFIARFAEPLGEGERLTIVKLLIAKFADLHEIKVAHRDAGSHCVWISPSKEVALSGFIAAYHQPAGTVGDVREHLAVSQSNTPFGMELKASTTPFQIDVHTLAILSWHILEGRRLSPDSLSGLQERIQQSEKWYGQIFRDVLDQQKFKDATDLFSALKEAEPRDAQTLEFDTSELDVYRSSIKVSREYPEPDDLIVDTDSKEIYRSDNYLVKSWLRINPSPQSPEQGYKVLHFCNTLSRLKSIAPAYLPLIHSYGIATKSNCLYLVTDFIDGDSWECAAVSYNDDQKKQVLDSLIASISHLHDLGLYHGDLHPDNVLIERHEDNFQVKLLDTPDFGIFGEESLNHLYSPENIDSCSGYERDNFAVMRMACDLLSIDWENGSEEHYAITAAVKQEKEDFESGFRSLDRFIDALTPETAALHEDIEVVEIGLKKVDEDITIFPDNGRLYAQIDRDNRNPDKARIRFLGLGGTVTLIYNPEESGFVVGFPPRSRDSASRKDIENSQLELPFAIKVVDSYSYDLNALNRKIREFEEFHRAVSMTLQPKSFDKTLKPEISTEDEELAAFLAILQTDEAAEEKQEAETADELEIKTPELWKAILDTEALALPCIEVSGEPFEPKGESSKLAIPYSPDVNEGLEKFRKGDDVEAILIDDDQKDTYIGDIDLKKSSVNEAHLKKLGHRAKTLVDGDVVYFRTKMDKASYQKRKNALKRLLDRSSVIPDLTDYFDPGCKHKATTYPIEVTDNDFERYDREDDHGNKISLNYQQRTAFTNLVQNGPLSLLQGPPGTGKTEFIAAFVHFLVEKEKVNNILLVSQSHEAVNTAAERIRKHCRRLETDLEVVRFSNREGTVSDSLKDVYAGSIVDGKRELFRVEANYRIMAMSHALGVEKSYLNELSEAEFKIFKKIDALESVSNQLERGMKDEDRPSAVKAQTELKAAINQSLRESYNFELGGNISLDSVKDRIHQTLEHRYGLQPNETLKAKALVKISADMLDTLGMERVNYDEFLARSRQLVTGTCVGIGQKHMGIGENQYDWVIIDEAARSISSELAIAMQSGKRVLLVGDHKQLPPMYSRPHMKAIAKKLGIAAQAEELESILKSDFERAFESEYGKQVQAQLLMQYRMIEPIGNLVSDCFYDGKLKTGERAVPDIYSSAPDLLKTPVTWLDTSPLKKEAHHRDDKGVSIYNRAEADQIIQLLKDIEQRADFVDGLEGTVKEGEYSVGVICMYGEQKRLIRQRFKEIPWSEGFKNAVKIDTVDSYQGKENRIIVLSITRADSHQSPGFLRSPNRINVALSRAMDRLVIVGSTEMWRGKNQNMPFGRVLQHIEKGGSHYSVCKAKVKKQQRRARK